MLRHVGSRTCVIPKFLPTAKHCGGGGQKKKEEKGKCLSCLFWNTVKAHYSPRCIKGAAFPFHELYATEIISTQVTQICQRRGLSPDRMGPRSLAVTATPVMGFVKMKRTASILSSYAWHTAIGSLWTALYLLLAFLPHKMTCGCRQKYARCHQCGYKNAKGGKNIPSREHNNKRYRESAAGSARSVCALGSIVAVFASRGSPRIRLRPRSLWRPKHFFFLLVLFLFLGRP